MVLDLGELAGVEADAAGEDLREGVDQRLAGAAGEVVDDEPGRGHAHQEAEDALAGLVHILHPQFRLVREGAEAVPVKAQPQGRAPGRALAEQ